MYSDCGGYWIMGGYNILAGTKNQYFERTYYGLPSHNQLNLTYLVLPVDGWDGGSVDDHYEVYVDGYYQRGWRFSAFAGYTIPLCGATWEEFPPVTAYSTFLHSGSTLTLRFINMLDQTSTDESLGIRDIKMKFITEAVPKYSLCGRSTGTPLPDMVCPCDTTSEYMNPPNSGTCFPCNGLCNTCYGAGSNQCYSCNDGSYLSGTTCYPCDGNCETCDTTSTTCTSCQPGWFMVGTTCYSTCNYPLNSYVSGGVTYCATPCPGQYVWWDQSCSSNCAYSNAYGSYTLQPVTINTFAQCNYPCGTSQFLYFNTSCLNTCSDPLTDVAYKVRNFCGYSCSTSQYLYWNGSCLNNCPWPLSPETQGTILPKQFCWYYCQPGEYMYWDGSCLNTCSSPLSKETQGTYLSRNFCWYTCQPTEYLYWNQSCLSNCPSPLTAKVQNGRNFCTYFCSGEKYLSSDGSCVDNCPSGYFENEDLHTCQPCQDSLCAVCRLSLGAKCELCKGQNILDLNGVCQKADPPVSTPTQSTADSEVKATFAAVTGSTVGAGLTLGATAALWSIINFQQFVGYFIYFNIQLPSHLIYFLTMFGNVNLEILPNPLASITDRLAKLWDSLVNNSDPKYQLPHKFAEFDTPTLFIINAGSTFFVCIIILLVPYLFDLLRKFKPLGRIKFIQNLHSNLRWNIPIRIFLESGIPLTFALLIQIRKISYNNVPYGISTITASLAFIYLALMTNYISQTLKNFKYEDLKEPHVENSIGTLFEGIVLKKEKPLGKYYYLLILLRGMLLVSVGVLAEQFPVVQTAAMAVFNLFFVYFVWAIIKFKSRYLNWTNRIKEVLILIAEILFVTLCYIQTEKYRDLVGWVIIGMLGLTLALELLFGFYLQILAVRDFVKWIREHRKRRKKVLVIRPVTIEETSRNFTIET